MKLRHKAIMHLEEFYLTGTKMYIILEIMRGGSLLDLILERGGLKEGEAKLVFKEVRIISGDAAAPRRSSPLC